MSFIILPVKAGPDIIGKLGIDPIANCAGGLYDLTEAQAKRIALALSLHDDLLTCLNQSHDALRKASVQLSPHFGNPNNSAFAVDAAMQKNETVLARAANEIKT